jgi:hypothetical protein
MLLDETGNTILKPLNAHEYGFYELLKMASDSDKLFPSHFFPKCYGSIFIESTEKTTPERIILVQLIFNNICLFKFFLNKNPKRLYYS